MSKTMKIIMITLLVVASLALSFGAGCALDTDTFPGADPALDVVEMLSVEAKKLPADTFVIPEGFTKSDMMDMPRMMRGGGGPGGPK